MNEAGEGAFRLDDCTKGQAGIDGVPTPLCHAAQSHIGET